MQTKANGSGNERRREECLAILTADATTGELRKWAAKVAKRPLLIRVNEDRTVTISHQPPRKRGRPRTDGTLAWAPPGFLEMIAYGRDQARKGYERCLDDFMSYENAKREARRRERHTRTDVSANDVLRERLKADIAQIDEQRRTHGLLPLSVALATQRLAEIRESHAYVVKNHGKTLREARRSMGLVSPRTERRWKARQSSPARQFRKKTVRDKSR